ncbi:MAG: hypothetical protein JKY53_02760 [Flavobacteriales bacterium]|nr:hypothetical protein [Flavobacteriales bacterium]
MNLCRLLSYKTQRVALLLSVFIFNSIDLLALGLPGGDDAPCGGVFGPCLPIDGGISFLLAAGVAYGSKKAFDSWKEHK